MTSLNDPFLSIFHSRPLPTPAYCKSSFHHDPSAEYLSLIIIIGLIISYLPQHYRIIHSRSSEGFSAFFLLLGATSSASSLLNIISLQWGQVSCCQYLAAGQCFESVLGIAQVAFQWFCFNVIFVLYLIYYPNSHKWIRTLPIDSSYVPPQTTSLISNLPSFLRPRAPSHSSISSSASSVSFDPSTILLPGQVRHSTVSLSPQYLNSVALFALTLLHLFLSTLTTLILLISLPSAPHTGNPPAFPGAGREHPSEKALRVWATTLGITSVILGCGQYIPQLILTARRKLVGSLSIPMMMLQTPGSFVFVYTLAVRPGVNWTGWGTYFVTGILQGLLLIMCLLWKARQSKLNIDDWGRPFGVLEESEVPPPVAGSDESSRLIPSRR